MYARDHAIIATPIGPVLIEGDERALRCIRILTEPMAPRPTASTAVQRAATQLEQYFAGERTGFDVAMQPAATPRGQQLRDALIALGYGATMTYGAFATAHGSAPRAIGQLCARNPFPIIVPCHRILAGGGALGHYSAGAGPLTKQWLLDHEESFSTQWERAT